MKRHTFIIAVFIFLAAMFNTACEKDFLDVNNTPNNPTSVNIELALPTALAYTAFSIGNEYQILGGLWGQYWTQGPTAQQYQAIDQYVITNTTFNRPWDNLYSGPLTDFKFIVNEGTRISTDPAASTEAKARGANYAAIGKIMQAYIFQVLTDLHGDIPFSEALKGLPGDGNIISPHYDSQETVYTGLITLIDEGIALIDENTSGHPGNDDFFYAGDMHLWKKFANTLKLRVYLRQSEVRPAVAQAGIQAMYTAGAEFLDEGESAEMPFNGTQFSANPLFASFEQLTNDNLVASNTALGFFQRTNDPRISAFYAPATAGATAGQQVGINQGNGLNLPPNQNGNAFSKPSPNVGGKPQNDLESGASAPIVIISAAESFFLQAEAAARGWGSGNAQTLYNAGVTASFNRYEVDGAADYLAQPSVAYPNGGVQQNIQAIITQKWAAMNGSQNIEAWTEWRRTGYPAFFTISATTQIGQFFPARLIYPDSETNLNPNTPPQKLVTEKVWWDINTSGQN